MNRKIVFLILFFLVFIPCKVYGIKSATSEFYVNDYADVLSESVKNHIMEQSVKLYNTDGTQIVVAVVNSLEGLSIEEYALNMFRNFNIGDKEKNNGILILLSISEREARIEIGYGLEGIINDGKAGRILDEYMIPSFSNDNWDIGISKGYDAIYAEVVSKSGLELEYDASYLQEDDNEFVFLLLCIITVCEGLVYININYGNKLSKMKTATSKKTACRYMILLIVLFLISFIFKTKYIMLLIFIKFIAFILGYLGIFKVNKFNAGYSSSRSRSNSGSFHRSSSSSRRSHRGGGGSSGGAGASRRF